MSRKKNSPNRYLYWIAGAAALMLAFGLWIWPAYISPAEAITSAEILPTQAESPFLDTEGAYQKRQNGALMLDVRTAEEWQAGHIPGATWIPLDQLTARSGELPRDQEIVIYCRSGNRSAQALDLLAGAGFEEIFSLNGGINDWQAAGYEVVSGE